MSNGGSWQEKKVRLQTSKGAPKELQEDPKRGGHLSGRSYHMLLGPEGWSMECLQIGGSTLPHDTSNADDIPRLSLGDPYAEY